MTRTEILQSKGLQSPDNIFKHINQLKHIYLKNSSNIVFELINEWEAKLEDKLTQLNLIK
jgi:hypothetical protein